LDHPDQAMRVYLEVADVTLQTTSREAYKVAIRQLKKARKAAVSADLLDDFITHVVDLRETHHRRPTFIDLFDRATLLLPE
jgi:uncharacterized Zn finger protein